MAQASNQMGGSESSPYGGCHVLIALGTNTVFHNLDLTSLLSAALEKLSQNLVTIREVSKFYATPCFPPGAGPDFVNAAAALKTNLPAHEFLQLLHEIEAEFGRERVIRWGQRTLDIDLIAYDGLVSPDPGTFSYWRDLPAEQQTKLAPSELILPHPRLQDRAFVLVPLMDVAPDWFHPVSGKTVRQMVEELPEAEILDVKPLVNPMDPA